MVFATVMGQLIKGSHRADQMFSFWLECTAQRFLLGIRTNNKKKQETTPLVIKRKRKKTATLGVHLKSYFWLKFCMTTEPEQNKANIWLLINDVS